MMPDRRLPTEVSAGGPGPAEDGPLALYRARRRTGTLTADPAQELAAEKLQSLHNALKRYRPDSGRTGWRARLGLTRHERTPAPQGLYLYGDVGRGKSMLMDLFFDTAPVERKRRVHFHAFMLEVRDRVHRWRQASRAGVKTPDDPITQIARDIAAEAWLICFDEFHVTDIADAMILGRLFTNLFEQGVVVVATSNWAPQDLYKDGLQRDRFLPFIDLLCERMDVLELLGGRDYRYSRMQGMQVYHWPLGPDTARRMRALFARLADTATAAPTHLQVQGRRLDVPKASGGVAWFTFDDLCVQPRGAADHLAIATHFHTVFLDGVPRLDPERRNEARRFMTLIDALYEHKVRTVIAAAAPPERLYPEGLHAFEFQRTVSRLVEMQSADYLAASHLP